ncbi:hypothetical protein NBO_464g0005 [Nosema bombycis CQ1]|uniref:Uncharacterized protein n=1 Tax=Nosema bombycis (strain CQ1 / CVCC 102059) TaxID=578461 RepID=R0MHQ2_NOSB1|nr:hypothetical protein NBO_464g0005 [Nosema bombycis CQ1]|eukprot:EOB12318.1 hypothetical protein NBO_464g0005 [Nosema bombycis CQ1]
MIPGVPTTIHLLKNGDKIPAIIIEIDENSAMKFYKMFPSDSAEEDKSQPMIFEDKHLGSIFCDRAIYIIEDNPSQFVKSEMNLVCIEALHNFENLKTKLNSIISASQDKIRNSLNDTNEVFTLDNTDWYSINDCLVNFDHFITCNISRIINEVFELHDIDTRSNDKELTEVLSQKVDLIVDSKSLAIYCRIMFNDVTVINESFLIEDRVRVRKPNVPSPEIKKAHEIVNKFYSSINLLELISKINIPTTDDETVFFDKVSELLNYFLKLIKMFEDYGKTRKSNEGTSTQENQNLRCEHDLKASENFIWRHITDISRFNFGNYKNVNFVKDLTIETITNDWDNVVFSFRILNNLLSNQGVESVDNCNLIAIFKNKVLKFKESVVRFKYTIDLRNSEISFKHYVVTNDLINKMHENKEAGHSSTD